MDIGYYKQATEFFIGAPLANIGVQKYSFLFGWIVEKYAQYYRNNGVYTDSKSQIPTDTHPAAGTESLTYFDALIEEMSSLKLPAPKSKPATAAETPNALKTTAVLLDSSPGRASLEGGSHFVTVGIKNSVARFIARNGVYVAYRMYVAINAGFSAVGLPFKDMSKHSIEIAAPYAVSEKNPDGNVTGRRLFLYSDEDKMCQGCKAEGIAVEEMMFIGSEHVKHAVVHREE
ncbi:hypothetical protein BJ741DRAFT_627492 [Chytriomyces cf. hyalinus JEL632]|nr:hypothetical protein BJ741DRAFT_627492 [Chytriomyces cf. hyalinus JEL632]